MTKCKLKYFIDIIIIILALVADNYNTQANYLILNVCMYENIGL